MTAKEFQFGEAYDASGVTFLASELDGILGLAYSSISVDRLPTFIESSDIAEKSFTFYLEDAAEDSYLYLSGFDPERSSESSFQKHSVIEKKYYSIQIDSIQQKGKDAVDMTDYKAAIDSGTSLIVGPSEVIDPVIEGITVHKSCRGIEDLPDITFTFSGIKYVLTYNDYVVKATSDGTTECVMGIASASFPFYFKYIIVGDNFFRRYPAYFSMEEDFVGFQTN